VFTKIIQIKRERGWKRKKQRKVLHPLGHFALKETDLADVRRNIGLRDKARGRWEKKKARSTGTEQKRTLKGMVALRKKLTAPFGARVRQKRKRRKCTQEPREQPAPGQAHVRLEEGGEQRERFARQAQSPLHHDGWRGGKRRERTGTLKEGNPGFTRNEQTKKGQKPGAKTMFFYCFKKK